MFPLIPGVIAAIKAAAPAIVATAIPTAGVASFALLMASTHDPNAHLARTFSKEPQAVAECMSRNARSAAAPLILQMQPLYGMEVVGVTVKRRFTGDAFLVATLTATPTGSAVEFRPAVGVEQPPDVLEKLIAGCD